MEFRGAPAATKAFGNLYGDYISDLPAVRPFFHLSPFQRVGLERRVAQLDKRPPVDTTIIDSLRRYQEGINAHPAAQENLDRLADGRGMAVLVSLRPSLFGGALENFYHVVTAIRLADWAGQILDRPVVPLLWILSDDHSLGSVNHIRVLNKRCEISNLLLELGPRRNLPMGRVPLKREAAIRAVGTLESELGRQPHGRPLREFLAETTLTGAKTPVEWFARIFAGLFSSRGLVLVDPLTRELAWRSRALLQQALVRRESVHRELRAAGQRLQRKNYQPLVNPGPEFTGLVHFRSGRRHALLWRDGRLEDRDVTFSYSVQEAARLLESHPADFGPNMVLRPLVQDFILPVLARVVGPVECGLLAQMGEVYPLFHLEAPLAYPRISLTLVGTNEAAIMKKYGLTFGAVMSGLDPFLKQELSRREKLSVEPLIRQQRDVILKSGHSITSALARLDPSMTELAGQSLQRMLRQLDYLEKKALQHLRRKHSEVALEFRQVANSLYPGNSLQETVFNLFPYLFTYGFEFVEELLKAPLERRHQLAFIGEETIGGE